MSQALLQEIARLRAMLDLAEAANRRLRAQLCLALQDQPEKLAQAKQECGKCGGAGPCVF